MEIKQHTRKQPLGQKRNLKKRKLENISRQTKIKHNMPKFIECNKNSTKRCGKILVVLGNNWSPMTLESSISVHSRIA